MAAPRSLAVTLSAGLIGLVLAACTSAATPTPARRRPAEARSRWRHRQHRLGSWAPCSLTDGR
jgi:hypothetical protein